MYEPKPRHAVGLPPFDLEGRPLLLEDGSVNPFYGADPGAEHILTRAERGPNALTGGAVSAGGGASLGRPIGPSGTPGPSRTPGPIAAPFGRANPLEGIHVAGNRLEPGGPRYDPKNFGVGRPIRKAQGRPAPRRKKSEPRSSGGNRKGPWDDIGRAFAAFFQAVGKGGYPT